MFEISSIFGKAGEQVFLDDVNLKFAKHSAELDVPGVRQVLTAKDDDDVFVKGALDFAKGRIIDVLREIEGDLRSAGGAALGHRKIHRTLRNGWAGAPPSRDLKTCEVRYRAIRSISLSRSEQPMARILLAESDERICEFLAGILADFGHEVITCLNDSEATVRLAICPIDVLVTDLVLREEEGSRLSRSCTIRGIPTITLTGQEFHADRAGQDRPMPLLDKPFRFADLERVLEAVVAHARSAQADIQPTRNAA